MPCKILYSILMTLLRKNRDHSGHMSKISSDLPPCHPHVFVWVQKVRWHIYNHTKIWQLIIWQIHCSQPSTLPFSGSPKRKTHRQSQQSYSVVVKNKTSEHLTNDTFLANPFAIASQNTHIRTLISLSHDARCWAQ